jgi:hypothetical protein
MDTLLLLTSICFSNLTGHQGCDETQKALVAKYHLTDYEKSATVYIQEEVGKTPVVVVSALAMAAYKKELVLKSSGVSLRVSPEAGQVGYTWRMN